MIKRIVVYGLILFLAAIVMLSTKNLRAEAMASAPLVVNHYHFALPMGPGTSDVLHFEKHEAGSNPGLYPQELIYQIPADAVRVVVRVDDVGNDRYNTPAYTLQLGPNHYYHDGDMHDLPGVNVHVIPPTGNQETGLKTYSDLFPLDRLTWQQQNGGTGRYSLDVSVVRNLSAYLRR